MLTQFLKFEISILPTVPHKFVSCVMLVLSMRTWCFIDENLIVYPEQGFPDVSHAASLVKPVAPCKENNYIRIFGNENDYFLKLLEQALTSPQTGR